MKKERGVAMTFVILLILMVSFVVAAMLALGYHQRILAKKAVI